MKQSVLNGFFEGFRDESHRRRIMYTTGSTGAGSNTVNQKGI